MSSKSYTFSEVFDSKATIEELFENLGFSYQTQWHDLLRILVELT